MPEAPAGRLTDDERNPLMVWQDSPPPQRGSYDWADIKRRLRRRPGKWTLIAEQATRSVQTAVRRGKISTLRDDPDYDYLVRTRRTNGSKADIWMSAQRKERG